MRSSVTRTTGPATAYRQPKRLPAGRSPHHPPKQPTPGQLYVADRRAVGMRVQLSYISGVTDDKIFTHNAPWRFQCPPMAPFQIQRGHDSQEYETVFDGTFSTVAAAKLDIVTFKTLMVEDDYPWVLETQADIREGRDILEQLSHSGTPFHLLCVHHYGLSAEYSGPVTLTDYTHTEDEPYAYYADVTFKQFRDPHASYKVHNKRHGGRTWPKHIKITANDSLYSLAKQYYGRPSAARLIAEANGLRSISFWVPIVWTGKIKEGATITLPRPPDPQSEVKVRGRQVHV